MFKFGWGGQKLAQDEWSLIASEVPSFKIIGDQGGFAGTSTRLWERVRRTNNGQDIYFEPQETGDCVAVSAADAWEVLQRTQLYGGDQIQVKKLFAPFNYGVGRVLIGKNQIRGAGCVGSWLARSIELYGSLDETAKGVPKYSGELADRWGNGVGFRDFMEVARPLTCTWARIFNWNDLRRAHRNGYVITMASDQGFEMLPRKDGFHYPSGVWEHQMFLYASADVNNPWVGIHNQWGDVHGRLIDFETGEPWPTGMIRCRPEVLDKWYQRGEIIAYSLYQGFPDRSKEMDEWSLVAD